MQVVLCEKPAQAADIAKVIGASKRSKGCFVGPGVTVTYCIGHLLENAPPEEYDPAFKTWSLETLPIIPSAWRMLPKKKTASQLKVVKDLIGQATELVIATDPDREGELIAWEVLEYCKYRGPAKRLHLSALNQASIRKAWGDLRPASESIQRYYSALARGRGDWLVGMNLSRLFTLLGQQAGYFGVLSIGRVQTPTLAIVVERERAISTFVSVPYWDLHVALRVGSASVSAKWVPPEAVADGDGRCIRQDAATVADSKARAAGAATVMSTTSETVSDKAPLPFSLGDLQQACSAKFGYGVQETLDIAQSLYETHKATTYPRADNGYLDESMHDEVPLVFKSLVQTDPSIATLVGNLDPSVKSRAWNSAKVTAHHGIIPTIEAADITAMSEKEASVYRLIRAHFLAQFLGEHVSLKSSSVLDAGGLRFIVTGKTVIGEGWRAVMPASAALDDEPDDESPDSEIPVLTKGDSLQITGSKIDQLKTKPPRPFTEGTLVAAMKGAAKLVTDPRLKQTLRDTTGIGTEATRAAIITTLIDRGYLFKKGRSLRASDAAFTLIDSAPVAVTNPGMTAVWEQALTMVEEGEMTLDDFVGKQCQWIGQMVSKYSGTTMKFKLEPGPACPLCQGGTVKRKGQNGMFWACQGYPKCKGTLPVEGEKPQKSRKPSTGKRKAVTVS